MMIGYDGKRAFQNKTGLGNYSRSLITILSSNFAQNKYILFTPKQTGLFKTGLLNNVHAIAPQHFPYKQFPSLWRRSGMVKQIQQSGADIYHGLSNELPRGIRKTGIKSVVTIHDLVFERFPETYNFDERYVHRWKIKHACKEADVIIAISNQTRNDLVDFYNIPANKIVTCYQSCNPVFERVASDAEKALIKKKYQLPDNYFLFVSSIAPRKNLLDICKALALLKDKTNIPLVVIGNGKKEKEKVKAWMAENGMAHRLIILNELRQASDHAFASAADFPAIYQQAAALIYPSVFEGFGLPVLEALWSGLPVICSDASSLPEVGGDAALYFSPGDHKALAQHILHVITNNSLAETLRHKGFQQARQFDTGTYANNIMAVYKSLL